MVDHLQHLRLGHRLGVQQDRVRLQPPGALHPHLVALAQVRPRAGDHDAVAARQRGHRVGHLEHVRLADLDLELLPGPHRDGLGHDLLDLALALDAAALAGHAFRAHQREVLAGGLLELGQPAAARPDHAGRDARVELDQEGLAGGEPRVAAQRAQVVDREALVGQDDALAVARRALRREDLAHAVRHVLARHLHQAQRRDGDEVDLGAVLLQLVLQAGDHGVAVLLRRHVDEVDDDDPADVAQPQLTHDLARRLQVVGEDRVLERLLPTKRPVLTSMIVNASA